MNNQGINNNEELKKLQCRRIESEPCNTTFKISNPNKQQCICLQCCHFICSYLSLLKENTHFTSKYAQYEYP